MIIDPCSLIESHFNGHSWRQPFKNINDSQWQLADAKNPTVFTLDSPPDKVNTITYDTAVGNNFQATYAYDETAQYEFMPIVSDLKVRFYVDSAADFRRDGCCSEQIRNAVPCMGRFQRPDGHHQIKSGREPDRTCPQADTSDSVPAKIYSVEFATIDHQLIFKFGDETLTFDLGRDPNAAGARKPEMQPQVSIFGSGKLTLSHVAVFS